ncbi:5-formyltetrahydrofolate cyclo-ligase [Chungangia koreensis]|uniref:5-formyltetrahydrofolate cyclo-ligase n=1 Tax=Chungangia koreensis TaxID=752657 RepID=A0ABV8X5C4_9LACT
MSKKQLRKEMLKQLQQMSDDQYWDSSKCIQTRFLTEVDFCPSDLIGVTISRKPEVDTTELIKQLWDTGISVAAPKCDPISRTMQFYRISSFNELETVYMDLKEPDPKRAEMVDVSELTFLIVPGVVFSPSGYRIGFGGGYYDRFLTKYTGPTASLAFDFQLVDNVPFENHDIPVDRLYTEKRIIDSKGEW